MWLSMLHQLMVDAMPSLSVCLSVVVVVSQGRLRSDPLRPGLRVWRENSNRKPTLVASHVSHVIRTVASLSHTSQSIDGGAPSSQRGKLRAG